MFMMTLPHHWSCTVETQKWLLVLNGEAAKYITCIVNADRRQRDELCNGSDGLQMRWLVVLQMHTLGRCSQMKGWLNEWKLHMLIKEREYICLKRAY